MTSHRESDYLSNLKLLSKLNLGVLFDYLLIYLNPNIYPVTEAGSGNVKGV